MFSEVNNIQRNACVHLTFVLSLQFNQCYICAWSSQVNTLSPLLGLLLKQRFLTMVIF